MSQDSDALGDRPNPIEPQGIDGQAAQGGQDLNAVVFPVAMGVFLQRHISYPVPTVLDRPALPDGPEQGLGASAQTRDVVTSFVLWLALADAITAHGDDRCAARPLLHHPLRCRHRPQLPGNVTASLDFPLAGAPGDPAAVGEPIANQAKPFAASMFDGDQEVGAALGEVNEKERFACRASA